MKASFRILSLIGLLAAPLISYAALQNGKIEFGAIKGKSVLLNRNAERKPAETGLVFEEGYKVETATQSTSELLLSNGATLVLEPNTSLEVRTFRQVGSELIQPGQYRLLEKEPSPSVTEIVVKRGKITGEVRKLNPQSTFTIKTPVGVARIRGTVYTIEYVQNKAKGVGNIKVSVVRGLVEVTINGSNTGPSPVPAGRSMSAQAPIDVSKGPGQLIKSTAPVTASNILPKPENGNAVSVGDEIAGPGIPKGTTVLSIDSEGNVTLSNPISIPVGATMVVVEPGSADLIRSNTAVVNSNKLPSVDNHTALSVGDVVIGPGIPEGTKVVAVDADGGVTLSKPINVEPGTELVAYTPDSTDVIRNTVNLINSTKLPAVENHNNLAVGDEVTAPGIPPGTKVIAVDADGNVTLSKPVNLIAGEELEVIRPKDQGPFIPVTISFGKLDPADLSKIREILSGGGGGSGGGDGGDDKPPASPKPPSPIDDIIKKIDDIIEKNQQTNPSPAGG